MIENNILGIILAGGKSSRFGEDKSIAKLGDKTLLDHTINKIEKEFTEILVISNNKEFNFKNNKICLSGFSQGCMMSLNVGLTTEEEFACIVGFSGKIIDKDNLSSRIESKPKTLLIHGEQDEIVPPSNLLDAKDFFSRNEIKLETLMIKDCDHHIPVAASSSALKFIKDNFNL